MVSEGRGRLYRRKDSKYLIYLPKDLCEDSMFPFKAEIAVPGGSVPVHVAFASKLNKLLTVTPWPAEKPK